MKSLGLAYLLAQSVLTTRDRNGKITKRVLKKELDIVTTIKLDNDSWRKNSKKQRQRIK